MVVCLVAFFGIVKWKWDVVAVVLGGAILGLVYKALI